MPTLRDQLAAAPPPVAMKAAWVALLRALRRAGGSPLRDRAALERLLDRPVEVDPATLAALKAGLRDLVHRPPEDPGALALALAARLEALAPAVVEGPVALRVEGWPPGLDGGLRDALLGHPWADPLHLPAAEAAALVFALDGRAIGGATIRVRPQLDPGRVLPAVPRDRRDRSPREGRRGWLPHLDEEGRRQLSPRPMAEAQARDLADLPVVIDAFAGCGGNALALARAGVRVEAVERDPDRAALLAANAAALGRGVRVHVGEAAALLPALLLRHPGAGLFLDPPWGGPGSGGRPVDFAELVPLPLPLLRRAARLVLKAPRAFALGSLPAGFAWSWRYELSPPGADGRAEVLAITCVGGPGAAHPAPSSP